MRFVTTLIIALLLSGALSSFLKSEVLIKITNPTDGAYFEPCVDLNVRVDVSVTADEEVSYVYLHYNGRTLARLRSQPWEYTWEAMKRGVYELSARAVTADRTEFWSDPVHIKVGPVSNGEKLFNGSFDCGSMTSWTGQENEGAQAEFNVYDDGYFDDPYYLAVEIENGGTAEWHIQINQTCPTDSGHVYTITFLAHSDEPKTIAVGMQENQDPWASQVWQTVDIDDADEYSLEFTASRTDPTNVLRFNPGGNTITFYLDDVRVVDLSASSVKSKQFEFGPGVVAEYELFQAYPNPFNINTTIQYSLSKEAVVSLAVYNMNGRKVATLADGAQDAGLHTVRWNGLNDNGSEVPSGLYVYKLDVQDGSKKIELSRKMLLLK
ncbi:carbohydrate binding domain-containing protein [candidate division KSB1 bacterium]|nr:carbohydrate binding domain-containing protein [candidate division KSB1 bacterium]